MTINKLWLIRFTYRVSLLQVSFEDWVLDALLKKKSAQTEKDAERLAIKNGFVTIILNAKKSNDATLKVCH